MSIEGPKKASVGTENGGTEGLTEEQKQKAAEEKAKADAAKTDSDIQNGLNGKKDGASQASGAGSAGGGGNTTIGGAGVQGSGGFGYGGIFGNTSLNVDQEQLNDLTNKFFNFTMNCGSLPFGIGTQAMQNSFGAWFQAIMNCFQFTNTTTTISGGTNVTVGGGQTVVSGGGETRLSDKSKAPSGYTGTDVAGVFAKDNKYYKYADNSYQLVECKADGSALAGAEQEVEEEQHVESKPKKTPITKPTGNGEPKPKEKTEADYAREGGYTKLNDGNYKGKDGKTYKYENGRFEYFADITFSNGQYIVNGTIYNKDGSKSETSMSTKKGTPRIYTEEHYKKQGGYEVTKYSDKTVYTDKDGNTLYFDSSGKLVQKNYEAKGFFEDGSTTVDRYVYNEKTGELRSQETYNNRTGVTVKKEYSPAKGQEAKAPETTQSQPHKVQNMDGQGRVSTYTVVTYTTTEVKIEGNTAIKITTTQERKVQ